MFLSAVLDDADEREQELLRVLAERRAAPEPNPIEIAQAHNALGGHYFTEGQYRQALGELRTARARRLVQPGAAQRIELVVRPCVRQRLLMRDRAEVASPPAPRPESTLVRDGEIEHGGRRASGGECGAQSWRRIFCGEDGALWHLEKHAVSINGFDGHDTHASPGGRSERNVRMPHGAIGG